MLKKISTQEVNQSLERFVSGQEDDYIIERDGKPFAALISVDKYRAVEERDRSLREFAESVERLRKNAQDVDPEILERTISEAVQTAKAEELSNLNS